MPAPKRKSVKSPQSLEDSLRAVIDAQRNALQVFQSFEPQIFALFEKVRVLEQRFDKARFNDMVKEHENDPKN